jgi:hypothetical protein
VTKDDIIRAAREAGLEEDDDLILEPETIWYITLAALMALEFLEALGNNHWLDRRATIASLRSALEQLGIHVPVAWSYEVSTTMMDHGYDGWTYRITNYKPNVPAGSIRSLTPLYTAPPKRKWQGLTDEELNLIYAEPQTHSGQYARAIEAKLKEKNS